MTRYAPHRMYAGLALVSLVVAGLFAWSLVRNVSAGLDIGSLLFLAISLGLLTWSVRTALTHVSLTPDLLIVKAPMAKTHRVDYGQILSVSEEGRMTKSIVVAYHPRTSDGMMDLDRARTVVLPAVQGQEALYEALTTRAPV